MRHALVLTAALATSAISSMPATTAAAADLSGLFAPATTGSCVFKKTEFSASDPEQTTTSATFTNVGDGGSATFTQARQGCVAGQFFANVGNTNTNDNVHLQVLLDGTPCVPVDTGDYVFANSGVDFSSHSVGFFCGANVAAGSHTVQVQWSIGVGGEAAMFQHMLEVSHR